MWKLSRVSRLALKMDSKQLHTVPPRPQVLVIFGPSGCGKSTLMKRLLVDNPSSLRFSVSRKP